MHLGYKSRMSLSEYVSIYLIFSLYLSVIIYVYSESKGITIKILEKRSVESVDVFT